MWRRHAKLPHVVWRLTRAPGGRIRIEARCTVCNDDLLWMCTEAGRAAQRIDQWAVLHVHRG